MEVRHENKKESCDRAVKAFLATGSHFMTRAALERRGLA